MALTLEDALRNDADDPLHRLRARFALPRTADGESAIYLCGHSLGLMPLAARVDMVAALDDWARLAVLGHEQGERPWITYHDVLAAPTAELLGCRPEEIAIMNTLSVNLQLMMASFFRPAGHRRCIVIEAGAFPSDRYATATHLQWHGLDPADALIEIAPRDGQECVSEEDIEALLARRGEEIALVLWPGVQYLTGQAFDLGRIARAARAAGALFGVDLAHSVGNMPQPLRALEADFAVWCNYKYLNAGPGAVAGCFVHQRHFDANRPRLAGWWGHELQTRFRMPQAFRAAYGAAGFQLSNQSVFAAAPLIASLGLFHEAGAQRLREKSLALGRFFAELLAVHTPQVRIITPREPAAHGAQLSLRIGTDPARARRIFQRLTAHGAICDWREPDIIRAAPAPLYNSFTDVFTFVMRLAEALRAA